MGNGLGAPLPLPRAGLGCAPRPRRPGGGRASLSLLNAHASHHAARFLEPSLATCGQRARPGLCHLRASAGRGGSSREWGATGHQRGTWLRRTLGGRARQIHGAALAAKSRPLVGRERIGQQCGCFRLILRSSSVRALGLAGRMQGHADSHEGNAVLGRQHAARAENHRGADACSCVRVLV